MGSICSNFLQNNVVKRKRMKILVTGAAGFVGSKVAYNLAQRGDTVVGIDNINDYYDVRLKYARLKQCGITSEDNNFRFCSTVESSKFSNYKFIRMSLEDTGAMRMLFEQEKFDTVINLAAQAGVRYSITNPNAYMESNMAGFMSILECCRYYDIKHLVFASSSSVYGMNNKIPFSEDDVVTSPVSLYAASKKSNELMAHSYSKLYGFPTTGLRYFTVYGPYGRPDMAPMLFAKAIRNGEPIKVFNNGEMFRDFTYIDDIVEGTIRVLDQIPVCEECPNNVAHKIYNIGCGHAESLMDFIAEIESAMGVEAKKEFLPMQPGDVYQTYADTSKLENERGYKPKIHLHEGIQRFIEWYQSDKNPLK